MGSSLLDPLRALRNRAPVPYTSNRLTLPWREPTGAEAQMRAMGSTGTLFAIVNRTSNATALVDWKLWRKAPSGLKEDRTEVTTHPALDLWNQPNPFYTRQEFVETEQQHIDLCGEGWWVIARSPRSPIPLELWPVRPDRMQPVPDPVDFISGYVYTSPDGQKIPLGVKDVIQIRMPNPLDPYRGMGPVQSILTEIDASRYSAEWNRNFFLNSAEPGGILEVDKQLSDAEFNEHTKRWAEQHRGVSNAHRVALLENGIKWVDRKLSQRDMQFAELRSVSRDVMREAFGAPAFILGEVGDVNRATALAAKALFAEQLTVPRLERFKGALNGDLLPLYGAQTAATLEFDYEDPVPPDAAARNEELATKTTAWATLVDAGADPAIAAEYLGLPDLGYRPPITVRTPSAQPSAAPPVPPAARLDIHHHTALPAAPAETDVWRMPAFARALTRRPPRAPRAQDDAPAVVLPPEVRTAFEDALARLLDDWDEQVLPDQYAALEEQIQAAVDADDTTALGALTVPDNAAIDVLRRALGEMATTAAQQMAAEAAAQGVTVKPPRADRALTNVFGSELVDIASATVSLLSADMAASAGREALRLFTPGGDGPGIASQVVTFLRGLKNWRRRDQLGGTLHRAQNLGRLATLAAAPAATYTACEINDINECQPCAEIDGTVFTDLAAAQGAYGAGSYVLCEGGVRCRGTVVATWDTGSTARLGGDAMRGAFTCTNRAAGARPATPGPDGTQSWYRIANSTGAGTNPCLYLYGDIGSWGITAAQCVAELAEIDAPAIDVLISSPGGEVFEGLAIYSALRAHPAKIMVRIDALAASIASVIAMAGDRVAISPGGQVMIHDASGVSCGDAADLRQYADFLDAQSENIASIYAERAGGTTKQWRARMQAETWYFADEAVAAGLADEVAKPARQDATTDAAMAAAWDLTVYNYAHTGRQDAPAPDAAPDAEQAPAADVPVHAAFDPAAFRAATVAALDPMPGYQPDHLRSLMAGIAGDAPAAIPTAAPEVVYVPPPAVPQHDAPAQDVAVGYVRSLVSAVAHDAPAEPAPSAEPVAYVPPPAPQVPVAAPREVAVDYFRSLFTAAANDAPTEQPAAAPSAAAAPQTVYVPTPPPPAGEVVTDYFRAVMADVANHAPAPPEPPAAGPTVPEPVPALDRTAFDRALLEARL